MQVKFDIARHETLWTLILPQLDTIDLAHDPLHILRVYHWALQLAPEAKANSDLCGAAALLHDLINIPKESQHRSEGSELSAIAGTPLLKKSGYSQAEMSVIVDAIRTCSWSKGMPPHNPEGLALQEADRLDAIGSIGIIRTIACAQSMRTRGNSGIFYHPTDPMGRHGRMINDREYAIDHFYKKLLKIEPTFTLPSAKKEGSKRNTFMLQFLEEISHEIPKHPIDTHGMSEQRHTTKL